MGVVIYGKHPAFGDFLSLGWEQGPLTRLEAWVQEVLPQLRYDMGDGWAAAWDDAPILRFWIGPDLLGTPLYGLWVPACDKVGRRYPFLLGVAGHLIDPPVHPDHDPTGYEALEAHLNSLDHEEPPEGGVKGLIEGIAVPQFDGTMPATPPSGMLWGQRADGDLSRLMRDATVADAQHAQFGRSHWWYAAAPGREAGWLSLNGLPDAAAMGWLLAEAAAETTEESHGGVS